MPIENISNQLKKDQFSNQSESSNRFNQLIKNHQLSPQQAQQVYSLTAEFNNNSNTEESLKEKYAQDLDPEVMAALLAMRQASVGELGNSLESSDNYSEIRQEYRKLITEYIAKHPDNQAKAEEVFGIMREYTQVNEFNVTNLIGAFSLAGRAEGEQGDFAYDLSSFIRENDAELALMEQHELRDFVDSLEV